MSALGELLPLERVDRVIIQDVWVGYSRYAPISAVYALRRTKVGGVTGEGYFSASTAKSKRVPVAIKGATVAGFLDALARTSLTEGAYEPFQDHTDDYPKIEIVLQVAAGELGDRCGLASLFTASQGEFHTPWAVFVGGAAYMTTGDDVGRALRALDRPLKRAELERLPR